MRIDSGGLARLPELIRSGRLYLTGARGSGKTTVGRLLAAGLGYGFCDLDHYLCRCEGRNIAEIVAHSGWQEFRRLEAAALVEASLGSNLVFATGGGVILDSANRSLLMSAGTVIWLKADAETLASRLVKNPLAAQRPGLTDLDMFAEVRQILAEREELYAGCCHHIVNGAQKPDEVCKEIMEILGVNA